MRDLTPSHRQLGAPVVCALELGPVRGFIETQSNTKINVVQGVRLTPGDPSATPLT